MEEKEMLSVETDIKEALDMLEGLGGKRSTVMRHLLSGIGTSAKNEAKKAYRSFGLHKRSGTLYKSFTRKVFRSGKAVMVSAKARSKDNVFYGYALAKGSLVRPKNGGWLTFQIDGKWVRTRSVKLPPRDFVERPVLAYLRSASFKARVDSLMEREIARIEKANVKNGGKW